MIEFNRSEQAPRVTFDPSLEMIIRTTNRTTLQRPDVVQLRVSFPTGDLPRELPVCCGFGPLLHRACSDGLSLTLTRSTL